MFICKLIHLIMNLIVLFMCAVNVFCLRDSEINMVIEYMTFKNVKLLSYFSCENEYSSKHVVKEFTKHNMRVSVIKIVKNIGSIDLPKCLHQWTAPVGVLLDGSCDNSQSLLIQASKVKLFDNTHVWLVFKQNNNTIQFIENYFQPLNLSVDADIAVSNNDEKDRIILTDVFNFGKIQGNALETKYLGSWRSDTGINISLKGFKYYHRWDFHNLTLRAITVILENPEVFHPELLSDIGYTAGIAAMTKITSQLLNLIKEEHNFRFNYTIAGRWIGSPERNSTLAVTNSLYWKEQDISSTCARIFPLWLNWVDISFPPTSKLQTKFYYLISEKGIGDYENKFLTPLSPGVWWCILGACVVCSVVLAGAAWLENRPKPGWYALFSVSAALCQQDFEDGNLDDEFSSQGRKLTLFVVGVTSMLLYNYYTSSVVSWLLSATPPSIDSLDQLMSSDLELIFEDIGYSRGWLENPGFYYYSGFKNPKEDKLRDKKVTQAKRSVKPLQQVNTGIELMRTGTYAYHTEPYTASQAISKTFSEEELCKLGSLQMMPPAPVYVFLQKRSPYREFITWSLMRLSERGHLQASRLRFAGTTPACSGRRPRALALGQAAPAFLLLMELTALSLFILLMERVWYRFGSEISHRSVP